MTRHTPHTTNTHTHTHTTNDTRRTRRTTHAHELGQAQWRVQAYLLEGLGVHVRRTELERMEAIAVIERHGL
jgi:hypothetical protein